MPIKNFSVGPSGFFPGIIEDFSFVLQSGIMEISHRSSNFTEISKKTIENLRRFLNIPDDYFVFYTSSASEAMEISLRSVIQKKSTHVSSGAFGERWQKTAKEIGLETQFYQSEYGDRMEIEKIIPESDSEGLFITANETSTGAAFSPKEITELKTKYPKILLCVDATSSAGAQNYNLKDCDAFLFSVQKCFGLPSGLGILICSPKFFQKTLEKKSKNMDIGTFHSLPAMQKKMEGKYQTSETPPILQIALLGNVIERIENSIGNLEACANFSKEKAEILWDFFSKHPNLKPFVINPKYYSNTVIVVKGSEKEITKAKKMCQENGISLAGGYGITKPNAFRIANFLASSKEDHQAIIKSLST